VASTDPWHLLRRWLSRSLAAYLCGTHSGLLASRRGDRLPPQAIATAHADFDSEPAGRHLVLGLGRWEPASDARTLADSLSRALGRPGVIDLILFGSHARGTTTGFSDVDAVLVVEDDVAEEPRALRALRSSVLSAQRAVIAHQPMQHHAFEVATPKLLRRAHHALRMPASALTQTCSLFGRGAEAYFDDDAGDEANMRFLELVEATEQLSAWPRHPWHLHVAVAMFELLPAVYLQMLGEDVEKWRSFGIAREHFGADWWPYDELEQVRADWLRIPQPALRLASFAARNPWVAGGVWRRTPFLGRHPARTRPSRRCLDGLQSLASRMRERAC
jgi:Nucleotidyltransferase domain